MKVLYVDVDHTLTGPGGDLFYDGSTRVADAIVRARAAGLTIVPISGRGRVQIFELCRLLGLSRGIAELGCVHVDGHEVRYELGRFPFRGETPVEAMLSRGAIRAATDMGFEPFDSWNEGREATYLLRGRTGADDGVRATQADHGVRATQADHGVRATQADHGVRATQADHGVRATQATAELAARGFGWCELIDNGLAYHLAPAGTGKSFGVRVDRAHHGLPQEEVAYVGDSASDLACAAEVGECWLVANADPGLEWPHRTTGRYGEGVAEVIDRLLARVR